MSTTSSSASADLARDLDWTLSYVDEREAFPVEMSGEARVPAAAWAAWDEPYRLTYGQYVASQSSKEAAVDEVRRSLAGAPSAPPGQGPSASWQSGLKLHAASLPLAEFAAVMGNLRAARFAPCSRWRFTALTAALDELRHAQIPLLVFHEVLPRDPGFDWTHRFLHTHHWMAIAARHMVDELLLCSDPIELAIGTQFVFETGFTNLQFLGLSSLAHAVGDQLVQTLLGSIQTDEARHSQIGPAVARIMAQHCPEQVQWLVDKWFWRSWHFFAAVTGLAMDYLTPLASRTLSFREFVEEWILDQFLRSLEDLGLVRPWYWDRFVESVSLYHHMLYASAYTYRATLWFDCPLPGPDERAWLKARYPGSWHHLEPVWDRLDQRWQESGPGVEWYSHGLVPLGFCDLCQFVLCAGTPQRNEASVLELGGRRYIFCSEPCRQIFLDQPERYAGHRGLVQRILDGEAPANLLELVHGYFGLDEASWGKDLHGGRHPWLAGG